MARDRRAMLPMSAEHRRQQAEKVEALDQAIDWVVEDPSRMAQLFAHDTDVDSLTAAVQLGLTEAQAEMLLAQPLERLLAKASQRRASDGAQRRTPPTSGLS